MTLKNSACKKLLTIGDCNTFSEDLLPIKDQLVVQIQKNLSNLTNAPIEIVNIGQGMATTREGLVRLKNTSIIPDYVTLNFGLVDAWVTSLPKLYIAYSPVTVWRKYPIKWLKIFKKKLRYIKGIIPRGNVVPKQEYIDNITNIIDICRSRNSSVKIIIWATVLTRDGEARNNEIKKYNLYLKDISKKTKCIFFDSNAYINNKDKKNYLDAVHLSPKATRKLGIEMAKNLK